jgi:hypothetical protein
LTPQRHRPCHHRSLSTHGAKDEGGYAGRERAGVEAGGCGTMNEPTTFITGSVFGASVKRWAKIGSTKHFATFCRLQWSEDLINELGVMYLTKDTERVKLNKNGKYYKQPFGEFTPATEKIIVKP